MLTNTGRIDEMAKLEPRPFITRWMQAVNGNEPGGYGNIAEHFGTSRQYIEHYARKLKEAGVKLPQLSRVHRKAEIPAKELNDLVSSLTEKATNT